MGWDLAQTPIIEAICPVVSIRAQALEVHPFLVWDQTVGAGFQLKIAEDISGLVVLYAVVMVLPISSVSRTEDQEPQSQRVKSQLTIILWLTIIRGAHLLPTPMTMHITGQILSPSTRMPSSSSLNLTVKTMSTRVLNMVSGPAHQMGIEN